MEPGVQDAFLGDVDVASGHVEPGLLDPERDRRAPGVVPGVQRVVPRVIGRGRAGQRRERERGEDERRRARGGPAGLADASRHRARAGRRRRPRSTTREPGVRAERIGVRPTRPTTGTRAREKPLDREAEGCAPARSLVRSSRPRVSRTPSLGGDGACEREWPARRATRESGSERRKKAGVTTASA